MGDERKFAQARWDVITADTAAELAKRPPVADDSAYVVVLDPQLDALAESLDTQPSTATPITNKTA